METVRLLFALYVRPVRAMSGIMDKGSWPVAAGLVLLVAIGFYFTVNSRLAEAYRIPTFGEYYSPFMKDAKTEAVYKRAQAAYRKALDERRQIPLVGDSFFYFFSFEPSGFLRPLIGLMLFYVPLVIFLLVIFGGLGNFGAVFRREYLTLAACALSAWAAGHLPFALVGLLVQLAGWTVAPPVYLLMWAAGGLLFGVFMIFALRTVFGASYAAAIGVVGVAWLAFSLGMYVFKIVSPWLFSPFVIILAVLFFGGFLGRQFSGFGGALREKRSFKRFLHNATVNPNDADARVQLGLIYLKRRQEEKALEYFREAFEIDPEEIDANYELGKLARRDGDLQKALDHFSTVIAQNDKHALSEVWREIGATYLEAGMLAEARDALEKFVERRPFDAEGLYYLGTIHKKQGEDEKALKRFREVIEAVKTAAYYRRGELRKWSRLAQKEI